VEAAAGPEGAVVGQPPLVAAWWTPGELSSMLAAAVVVEAA
jgi:hypothetical protein